MRWTVLFFSLALAGLGAPPAPALQKHRVALLPAHTFKGARENGALVTEALRTSLQKAGLEVASPAETDAAVKRLKLDLTRPQFVPALTALAAELRARYVVYPRVQAVGVGINARDREDFQATILLNVAERDRGGLIHTHQVGQAFRAAGKNAEEAVLPRAAAAEATARLLDGFYKKLPR